MKNYNDIGDLYKEMFSDYAPEPPASVWENVQSAIDKKQSLRKKLTKKLTFSIGAIIAVSAVVYLFIAPETKSDKDVTATLTDTKENLDDKTKTADYGKQTSENLPEVSNNNNVSAYQEANTVNSATSQNDRNISLANNNSVNENLTELSSSETLRQSVTEDKKTTPAITSNVSTEQAKEQNPTKTAQDENKTKKKLPIISKDTSICENTEAKLYAYNAENIRWSTGETKNVITVYPSNTEQYSLTFSTENAKDTTVYINVKVVHCVEMLIPNAFTPNGDGLNDFFTAKIDMELKSFEMIIYSPNGRQVLFTSKDINRGWDGTYKGQTQTHGLYYYTIRYVDSFGKNIEKRGELLLINQ